MAAKVKVGKWNPAHHPRDSRGRFTKSATRVMSSSEASRADAAARAMKPINTGTGAAGSLDAATTLTKLGGKEPSGAMRAYLDGGWKETNSALRTKKDAAAAPEIAELDAEFTPLAADALLERRIPLATFNHIPLDQLEGMKVRDAAPASTMLDGAAGPAPAGMVSMHIAAPKGTSAYVNTTDGEVLLARDTEVSISRAVPDGNGGWDLYGTVIPRTPARGGKPTGKSKDADSDSQGAGSRATAGGTAAAGDAAEPADDTTAPGGGDRSDVGGSVGGDGAAAADAAPAGGDTSNRKAATKPQASSKKDKNDSADDAEQTSDRGAEGPAAPEETAVPGTPAADTPAPPAKTDRAAADVKPSPAWDTAISGDQAFFAATPIAAASERLVRAKKIRRSEKAQVQQAATAYGQDPTAGFVNYTTINAALRGGRDGGLAGDTPPEIQQVVDDLDRLLDAAPLPRDTITHRGIQAPELEMPGWQPDGDNRGLQFTATGYQSTSTNPDYAASFADGSRSGGTPTDTPVIARVLAPAGTPGLQMSAAVDEVLLPRGRTFRVVSDQGVTDGVRRIDVELVPDAPAATAKPAPDPLSAEVAAPSVADWFGHGSPGMALYFGSGDNPDAIGTPVQIRMNGGRGKKAGIVLADTSPDQKVIARAGLEDKVWLADLPGAPAPQGRRADGSFDPDGTPADLGVPSGPSPTAKQLDVMLGSLYVDEGRLNPSVGKQLRAQLLRKGWADENGQLTPDGYAAVRRSNPDRYRDAMSDPTGGRLSPEPAPARTDTPDTDAPTAGTSAPATADAALTAAPVGLHRDSNPPLNDEQRAGLAVYQDGSTQPDAKTSHAKVNAALRAGKPGDSDTAAAIAGIDSAMAASPLAGDVLVYRGDRDKRAAFGKDNLVGFQWREDAYVSTGPREQDATPFAGGGVKTNPVLMSIRVPAGVGAVDMFDPKDQGEQELLLDRGHDFRVTADNGVVDGVRRLDVEMLPKGTDSSAPTADLDSPSTATAGTNAPAVPDAPADNGGMSVVRTRGGWAVSGGQPYYLHEAKTKKAAQAWMDDALASRREVAAREQASAAAAQVRRDRYGLEPVDPADLKPGDVYVSRDGRHTRTVTQVDVLSSGAVMVRDTPGPDAVDDPLPHLLFPGGDGERPLRFRDPAQAEQYRTDQAKAQADANAELASAEAADRAAEVARIAAQQELQERHTPAAVAAAAAHDPADFDQLDPAAPVAEGDLVMLRAYGKVRTGVVTKVDGARVEAIVAKPGDDHAGLFGGTAGTDVRRIPDAPETPAPGDAPIPASAGTSAPETPAVPDPVPTSAGEPAPKIDKWRGLEDWGDDDDFPGIPRDQWPAMRARRDATRAAIAAGRPAVAVTPVKVGRLAGFASRPAPAENTPRPRRTKADKTPTDYTFDAIDSAMDTFDGYEEAMARQRVRVERLRAEAAAEAAPAAAGAVETDLFGAETAFSGASRSTIGVSERGNVGRDTGALAQQLGAFDISDQQQMAGQSALLDSLMQMPVAAPPASVPVAAPDAPDIPARVPDDITGWSDEQLSGLFSELNDAPDDQVDVEGMNRILGEWDRRETEMKALLARVPDDLTTLDDSNVMSLFAEVTSHHGTMGSDAVARLEADLDRRDREAADWQAKRTLADQPPSTHATWDDLDKAFKAAADLDDEAAMTGLADEMGRREASERSAQLQAERDRQETARQQAQAAAETATAASVAETARKRVETDEARALTLTDRLDADDDRRDLADDDAWKLADQADKDSDDKFRYHPALNTTEDPQFARMSDQQVKTEYISNLFNPGKKPYAMQALAEHQRREAITLARQVNSADSRKRRRLLTTPIEQLTDDELDAFPALIDALPPGKERDRVRAVRVPDALAELDRRANDRDQREAAIAAGPAGPARVSNPLVQLARIDMYAQAGMGSDSSTWTEARGRLDLATKHVLGIEGNPTPQAVASARKKDHRDPAQQAAEILAWYRHLGQYDDRVTDSSPDWVRGPADEPGLPDVVAPLPAEKIQNADKVLQEMTRQATIDRDNGDRSGEWRFNQAQARMYRIPFDPDDRSDAARTQLFTAVADARRRDDRTDKQRASALIAEWRRLSGEQGVDPFDSLRYGPSTSTGKTRSGSGRKSDPVQEAQINALVAKGVDWLDAYAQVHQVDAAKMRRQETDRLIRSNAMGAKNLAEAYKAHYNEMVYEAHDRAEAAISGHMLNAEGQKLLLDGKLSTIDLFTGSSNRAYKYASEDLKRWWGENPPPRMTFQQWRETVQGDPAGMAAAIQAQKGNEHA